MRPVGKFLGALLASVGSIAPPSLAETEDLIGDVTVYAPDNVYSEDCRRELLLTGQDTGCFWDGQCGVSWAEAVPLSLEAGWHKAQVIEGGWASKGSCCGVCAVPEHTWTGVLVPSTEGNFSIGSDQDLELGDSIYFFNRVAGPIYVLLEDIDNLNNGGAVTVRVWRSNADDDNDGYQDSQFGGEDCDDDNPQTHPGATEVCDGMDNDCDAAVDEDTDGDGDGSSDCTDDDSDGFTELEGDCDDRNPGVYPCAQELYDGADNDCDGSIDNPANAAGCSCGEGSSTEGCAGVLLVGGISLWSCFWRRKRSPFR